MIANKIRAIRKRINKKANNINDLNKIGVARAIGGSTVSVYTHIHRRGF